MSSPTQTSLAIAFAVIVAASCGTSSRGYSLGAGDLIRGEGLQSSGLHQQPESRSGANQSLSRVRDIAEIIQAAAAVSALVIGGVWTYLLFVRQRQRFPRAEVEHEIAWSPLTNDQALVHVSVEVKNVGNSLIRLTDGYVQIQQVRPLESALESRIVSGIDPVEDGCAEIEWPLLGRRDCDWQDEPREIEPGETDGFPFDFVIPVSVATIEVYSHFRNVIRHDRPVGWNLTTLCELRRHALVEPSPRKERTAMAKTGSAGKSGKGGKVTGQGPSKSKQGPPKVRQGPPKSGGTSGGKSGSQGPAKKGGR